MQLTMNKKQVIRMVAFALVVVLLVAGLTAIVLKQPDFAQTEQRFDDYKGLKDDTVDVVFTGTSGIDRYYISAKGFEEYGLTAYPLTSDAQPAWLIINVLKEAVKEQSPQLVVIDTRPFTTEYNKKFSSLEAGVRYITDGHCLSFTNELDALNRSFEALNTIAPDEEIDKITYYLPIIKHHGAWANIQEFADEYAFAELGFYMSPTRTLITTKAFDDYTGKTDEQEELHEVAKKYLLELLDYLDTQSYDVLFLNTPQGRSKSEMQRLNTVCDIVSSRGYDYLVCQIDDTYDIETDFYNDGHVNYYGAEKFTDYFSQYLKDNYDLEDRRNDEACADWYGHYDVIKDTVAQWEAQDATEAEQ